jgi:hypothetical protein
MDDITQRYEFQQLVRDAVEYRMLRRILDAGRATETTRVQEQLGIKDRRRREAGDK